MNGPNRSHMNKIKLIIWREFITRVRKPSFLIMTILGPLLIAGGILLTVYLASREATTHHVLVIDTEGVIGTRLKDSEHVKFFLEGHQWSDSAFKESPYTVRVNLLPNVLTVAQADLYYKKLPSDLALGIVRNELEKAIELAKLRDADIDKEDYDRVRKPLDLRKFDIQEVSSQSFAKERSIVGFFFGYIMFFFIFLYGVQVMRGVMEEKQNRIVEVLISSVRPFQLMMGKIMGIALVGLVQFILWIVIITTMIGAGTAMLASSGQFDPAELAQQGMTAEMQAQIAEAQVGASVPTDQDEILGPLRQINIPLVLAVFLFYFIGGYLLYSSLLAAIGSAVDSETDTQQFMFPVTVPMIIAIIVAQMAVYNAESPAVLWCSFFPFTSPIVMMVRVAMGSAPIWQLLLSMALLAGAFIGTTWLAGRIYRTGILMYGKKVSWKEMGKWLFYKG